VTEPQPSQARTDARLWPLMRRAAAREFVPDEPTPCERDPELWFDYRKNRRAIRACAPCPFIGRCGWNAIAAGATHGVWGGLQLPGDYPAELAVAYRKLLDQFDQRRPIELGNVPVHHLDIAELTRRPPVMEAASA
jgi:WhiB family transcriptional regulator, redox-sensing transcriptional regulator